MRSLLLLLSLSYFSSIAEAFLLSSNRPSQSFASRIPLKSAAITLVQDTTDKETLASYCWKCNLFTTIECKDKTVASQFGRWLPVEPPCLTNAAAHWSTWFSDGLATTMTIDTANPKKLLHANAWITPGLSSESDVLKIFWKHDNNMTFRCVSDNVNLEYNVAKIYHPTL